MTRTDHIEMGVLRVLTLEDPDDVSLHGRVIEANFPNITARSDCIPEHPEGIPTVEAEADALPYVEELGRQMATDVDVLTISCALDPGVRELDAALDIPVIGAGASVAGAALARGERVGTVGLESGTPPNIRSILGERLQASETVSGADTTNFLMTDEGRTAIRNAVSRLAAAGCDVVAPSCTGITTSGVLNDDPEALDIPVVDPVLAMAAMGTLAVLPTESERPGAPDV